MDEYTPTEKAKLLEFRELVSDVLTKEAYKHDSYLIRWLRARHLDLGKAEQMLRKNLEWRKENRIDGILDREDVPDDLKRDAPMAFLGTNREGLPMFMYPMGRIDYRRALEKYGIEACNRFNIINMEKLSKILETESEKQGRKVTQIMEIVDLEGYSYRQMSTKLCRDFMMDMQRNMDSYYPELLRYAVVINAPKVFALLFAMMKPFIPKITLEKFDIYGPEREKWQPIIAKMFSVEKIPPAWGGTLVGNDEFCSENKSIWLQGRPDLASFLRGFADSDGEYSVVVINAREKIVKELDIPEVGTIIEWKFKTKQYDIGFQVSFCSYENQKETTDILPSKRVNAHSSVQKGSAVCSSVGKYFLIFDNEFSVLKPKTLLYKIIVIKPQLCD